jgi:mono/diheme cytochrome c family protein
MAVLLPCTVLARWMCQTLPALVVLVTGPASNGQHSAPGSPAAPIQVYRASCLECHDGDGRGEIARELFPKIPDFTDAAWQSSRADAQLSKSILEGKKSMPKMREKLGSVDVQQMVGFVRGFRGGKQVVDEEPTASEGPGPSPSAADPIPASPRRDDPTPFLGKDASAGEEARIYQRLCSKCHASDGKGAGLRQSLPTIPDFTVHSWQAGRNDPQLIASVLDGKGVGMPAFRDKLSRAQARDLIALVRSFDPSRTKVVGASPDVFEARFRELEKEFEGLSQQIRALSSTNLPARRGTLPRPGPPSPGEKLP